MGQKNSKYGFYYEHARIVSTFMAFYDFNYPYAPRCVYSFRINIYTVTHAQLRSRARATTDWKGYICRGSHFRAERNCGQVRGPASGVVSRNELYTKMCVRVLLLLHICFS